MSNKYQRLIPRDVAVDIVSARKGQGVPDPEDGVTPPILSLREFAQQIHANGATARVVSVLTLRCLLEGRMYPDLTDPDTGKTFDWSALPKSSRGRPQDSRIDRVTEKTLRDEIDELRQRVRALEETVALTTKPVR